jgi:hypothetical protein
MTDLSLHDNNDQSPFDSIRRFDERGKEYWFATELLTLLGYKSWKRQKETVERAILSATNSGQDTDLHFDTVVQMARIGDSNAFREVVRDFKLTRYASYLTAQNGDPRKPEIAAAQSYFAIKTREAEIIIPQQSAQLKELELRLALAEAERDAAIAQKNLLDKREAVLTFHEATPAALILGATIVNIDNVVEKVIDKNSGRVYDGIGITEIAKRLGFRKTQDCWQWLESIGYGKDTEAWEMQLSAVEHPKLKRDALDDIIGLWNKGKRQRLIGEN